MDLSWLSAILVGAGCLAIGYCIGSLRPSFIFLTTKKDLKDADVKKSKAKEPLEIEKLADILDDFKMVTSLFSLFNEDFRAFVS